MKGDYQMNEYSKGNLLALIAEFRPDDDELLAVTQSFVANKGDLEKVLNEIAKIEPQYGTKKFLENIVDETFNALIGKDEIIDRLERARRTFAGNVATNLALGAGLICGATGLKLPIAAAVFLYLIPIGVRAAFKAWNERKR